jgi:hypothetical protein
LKQPYAHLLASGKKTVELRKWNTKFRGQFLIHASFSIDDAACKRLDINQGPLTKGGIIGKAYLYMFVTTELKENFKVTRKSTSLQQAFMIMISDMDS